uniref:CSON001889 protein n=1 Tax=Culicoides sonorensis TaxID=179676 RepID=A0A336MLM6_CULSO
MTENNRNSKIPFVDEESTIGIEKDFIQVTSQDVKTPDKSDTSLNREEARDNPGPLPDSTEMRRKELRRNSISLPALNSIQMDALKKIHNEDEEETEDDAEQQGNSMLADDEDQSMACSLADRDHDFESIQSRIKYKTPCKVVLSSDEEEEPPAYNPKKYIFRNKRRLSIAPLPSLRVNDKEIMANEFDTHSVISNQASITSASSLASLLKEKMQAFPHMIRKRRKPRKDVKIKVFVGILFLVIVFLVGYAYVMYQQTLMARSYFEKIKFNKGTRVFRILDNKGEDIITGLLGANLSNGRPFRCLPEDTFDDGSVCLEWVEKARLYLNEEKTDDENIKCYTIHWKALVQNWYPTDCFFTGPERGHWFGGGLLKGLEWPLEQGKFNFAPLITGDHHNQQFGNAVKRYFLNSKGAAIKVDEKVPLYLSMGAFDENLMCLKSKHDDFAFLNRQTELPEMKYKICTGPDMKSLHSAMTQKSLWDGLKEEDISCGKDFMMYALPNAKYKDCNINIHSLLEEPIWQIPALSLKNFTETSIYNYTETIIEMGFLRLGHVLINEFWQKNVGDFKMDEERFPTLENTINILHRRGFKIVLTIQPFISTESARFAEVVAKQLVISERGAEYYVPALTRYHNAPSVAMLDITNNATLPWMMDRIKKLRKAYSIDSFYFDIGNGHNVPRHYKCHRPIDNPDEYKTLFLSKLENVLSMIGISSSVTVPKPPTFLSLPPVNASWEGMRTVVISAITYGVTGYPFIISNPVGGDFLIPENNSKSIMYSTLTAPPLPDPELYIRWLQLSTFLPVIRFNHLPSEYKNEVVEGVAKELTTIRSKTVIPVLKKYLNDAMNEGLALIRPLWMMDSTDASCLTIDDEFSVGEDLIVAPIMNQSQFQREVYLPQGIWKDGIDGSLRKGSRWMHNYKVPLDKVAYFVKMPDNTRF